MQRRKLVVAGLLALGLLVPLVCGAKDDDGPPPSIGDATNLERPPPTTDDDAP